MIADTCFLIDLGADDPGTQAFFLSQPLGDIFLTTTVLGELLAGVEPEAVPLVVAKLAVFPLLRAGTVTAMHYARIVRLLGRQRTAAGVNDAWIAATALEYGYPVLTRNTADSSRVPGLGVVVY